MAKRQDYPTAQSTSKAQFASASSLAWQIIPYDGETEFKRFRIKNVALIQTVTRYLHNGDYVVVLGAHFSEKSRLMIDIQSVIADDETFRPIYLNLWQARSDDEKAFFSSLEQLIISSDAGTVDDSSAAELHRVGDGPSVYDARSFQRFITYWLHARHQHLVLLIDHLQALPHDLIQTLLKSLRAIHTELPPTAPYKIMAVVAGGFDLLGFSYGSTSPFNIAKRVIVEPLDEAQSRILAEQTLQSYKRTYTANAMEQILQMAGGDHYLIPLLCQFCYDLSQGYTRPTITQSIVRQATDRLLQRQELLQPIRDAMQLIEEDADTLLDTLDILQNGELQQNQSRQDIVRTGASRLQLSGAFAVKERGYRIKNDLYHRSLKMHFTPAHVARVLRMSGRWEDAIAYLTKPLAGELSEEARIDLLEAIIQSIYAANGLDQAFALMAKGLDLGFNLPNVVVYSAKASRRELQLVYPGTDAPAQPDIISLTHMDRVEAQTFASGEYSLRSQPKDLRLVSALVPEKRPIGVIIVDHFHPHMKRMGLPPQLPELQRFLRYAAGAIEDVMMRTAFQEIGQAVLNAGAVEENLHRVLEIVANAVGGDIAAFYLFDADRAQLTRRTTVGIDWETYRGRSSPISVYDDDPAAVCFREAIGQDNHTHSRRPPLVDRKMPNYVRFFLPLQAADSRLGVLKVGYEKSRWSHFNQDDITRLYTFADQVAIAVYNMQLLQRTEAALARSVRELEKLQDISRTLSTATNVNLIFREIIQAIQTLFPGSEVTMWEFGIATQQFKILESSIHDQTYRALVLDLATTTGVAVQQRKVIMRDHCRGEVHDVTWQIMQSLGLEKLVVVPMTSRGETLGAISLYVKREQQVDDTHQALLMAIAAQAASAIENAHQFTSLQEAERKLIQSRDQDLLSISQVLLHRLGNAGDVSYHIEKINGVLDDKSGQSSLLHIEQRISRLLDLLPSLQTVVQLDEVSFQPLNLRELIQSAFDGCTTCHHHRLTYVPVLSNVAIEGDWGTLSDAFQSVIENGCEAMAGKGEVLVTVVLDFDSDRVRVRIRDSGMGIPQRIHKKIFDLGFTTKSAEQNRRGRGLFTCRAILRKHRGDIELVDTGPQGTAFEIVLPRVSDPNAEVG